MKYSVLSVSMVFLFGFLTGSVSSHFGLGFPAFETREAETVLAGQESSRPGPTPTTIPGKRSGKTTITTAQQSSTGSVEVAEETRDPGFPPGLPPHVADPYFFGTEIDDPDVLWQREDAVRDFIASLEGSGLPAEEIEALATAAEAELAAITNPEPDTAIYEGDILTPPSRAEQADDLARSLRQAGHPEELVDGMVNDFWTSQIEEPVESGETIMPPDPHDPEGLMR